jgi:hypothetical protein
MNRDRLSLPDRLDRLNERIIRLNTRPEFTTITQDGKGLGMYWDRDRPATLPKNEGDNQDYGKGLQRKLCDALFTPEISNLRAAFCLEVIVKGEKVLVRPHEEELRAIGISNLEVDRASEAVETFSRIIRERAMLLTNRITPYYKREDFPAVVKSEGWLSLYAKAEALARGFGKEYGQILEDSTAMMKAVGTTKEFYAAKEYYCASSLKLSYRMDKTAEGLEEGLKALLA